MSGEEEHTFSVRLALALTRTDSGLKNILKNNQTQSRRRRKSLASLFGGDVYGGATAHLGGVHARGGVHLEDDD